MITRAHDFAETGNYRVTVGKKVFLIYRNSDSTTSGINKGDWLVDPRHLPDRMHEFILGRNKDEAVAGLVEIAATLKKPLRAR